MADIYYETDLYTDDEVKDRYIKEIMSKDSRAIDKSFVDLVLGRSSIRVTRKCYMSVSLTCDKYVAVHYSAHKKVEETTGYTVTKRTDAMGIDDYKISENTKKVTYTDENDYSKKFYDVSEGFTVCVDNNFSLRGELPKRAGDTREMPAVYSGVTKFTGVTAEMKKELSSSSGCSSQVNSCWNDIEDSAKSTGYKVDSCKFKHATVSNIVVKSVHYYVLYYVSVSYNGQFYTCELGHDSLKKGITVYNAGADFPRSKELENRLESAVAEGESNKRKARVVTVPATVIGVIGIIMSFVAIFKIGFGAVIGSLVFNIVYMWWAFSRLPKATNEKIEKINEQYARGEYIHDVTMPEIKMPSLILKSLLLTFWNVLIICSNFLA